MGHEYWNGHRLQHIARYTPKNDFAQPRVPVAPHHDQCTGSIRGIRQDGIGYVDVRCSGRFNLNLDVVAREVLLQFNTANFMFLAACLLVEHDQQVNSSSPNQERQSIVDCACRSTAAIPTTYHPVELQAFPLDIWNHDERSPRL